MKLPEFHIKFIPHNEQKINCVGDYWIDEKGVIQIRVSDVGNTRFELAWAIHELCETGSCLMDGVTFDEIDRHIERKRLAGIDAMNDDVYEGAPHLKQHLVAEKLELKFLALRGLRYAEPEYEKLFKKLEYNP